MAEAKQLTVYDEVTKNLMSMEDKFKAVLPKHVSSAKFNNVVVTALRNKPDLLKLNRQSLYNSCMDCATDGLLPDGREAALVPFKNQVKYMPMVAGITKKVRNSGEILTIDAIVVYENDEYNVWTDEKGPHFKHVRAKGNRGKPILTYAYAITKDGGVFHEEVDEVGLANIAKCCKASNTPWKGPFKDEMKRKSVLRRLCKYRLPSSTDMEVIRRDDDIYDLGDEEQAQPGNDQPATPSNLEKAVGGNESEVVDAEFTPAPEEVKEAAPAVEKKPEPVKEEKPKGKRWQTEGKVEGLTEKKGTTNEKDWIKYGGKVNGKWYGTFSSTYYGQMREAKNGGLDVNIIFEEAKVGDKTVYNIIELKLLWDDEQPKENITEVHEDEIPI